MAYYKRSIVIRTGNNAICVAEASFENRKYDYTLGFFLNESAKTESICQSLSLVTAFRGVHFNDEIARAFLDYKGSLSFPIISGDSIPSSPSSIEIIDHYESNLKSKNMIFFKVFSGESFFYGGCIKEKSLYREIDSAEVLLNIENDNAFIIPDVLGEIVEATQNKI